jgi:hypothetical protein
VPARTRHTRRPHREKQLTLAQSSKRLIEDKIEAFSVSSLFPIYDTLLYGSAGRLPKGLRHQFIRIKNDLTWERPVGDQSRVVANLRSLGDEDASALAARMLSLRYELKEWLARGAGRPALGPPGQAGLADGDGCRATGTLLDTRVAVSVLAPIPAATQVIDGTF